MTNEQKYDDDEIKDVLKEIFLIESVEDQDNWKRVILPFSNSVGKSLRLYIRKLTGEVYELYDGTTTEKLLKGELLFGKIRYIIQNQIYNETQNEIYNESKIIKSSLKTKEKNLDEELYRLGI